MIDQDIALFKNNINTDDFFIESEFKAVEKLRLDFVSKFPINKIQEISIDEYVIGKGSHESFCYILENSLKPYGDIHGATSKKFGIYYGVEGDDKIRKYRINKKFGATPEEAFFNIRNEINNLVRAGLVHDLNSIAANPITAMFKGKILSSYFPDKYLNVFSSRHLDNFLDKLGIEFDKNENEVYKREKLLEFKSSDREMVNWSFYKYFKFLYKSFGRPGSLTNKFYADNSKIKNEIDYSDIVFSDIDDVKPEILNLEQNSLSEMGHKNIAKFKEGKYEIDDKFKKEIGDRGELIIFNYEVDYLKTIGRSDLSLKVDHKSLKSDSFGYDILSRDDRGRKKYIEVKSTIQSVHTFKRFFISANEYYQACNKYNYYIYIVFEVNTKHPKILKLKNPFKDESKYIKVPESFKIFMDFH
ncbi:MAG: DUF3883 domain-containing protein [Candidatus Buchananbacteria bacterium]